MGKNHSIVAIYTSQTAAKAAIKEMQRSRFDIHKLSIIGRDYHSEKNLIGYYNIGDRMMAWGNAGAFWGALWRFMPGSAFFLVPGIGPLLVAGPLAGWMVGGLEGAVMIAGLTALGAAFYTLGIPKDSILKYEGAVKTGKFVMIAHGTSEGITQAKEILGRTESESVEHHQ